MPIRGLDQGILSKSLQKLPLKVLQDEIVAVDGFWYLKKYAQLANVAAHGCMEEAIERALKPLLALKDVQILWVWEGLDYAKARRTREGELARGDKAGRAATELKVSLSERAYRGTIADALANGGTLGYGGRAGIDQEIYVAPTTRILQKYGVSVVRAPYSAMAQCVYFLRENCVSYIFTMVDALLFVGGTKIVVDFGFDEEHIETVDRVRLFAALDFNLPGFQSYAFLSGCDFCPTVPCYANDFVFSSVVELAREKNLEEKLYQYYLKAGGDPAQYAHSDEAEYIQHYYSSFVCIEYHPVMSLRGTIECLNTSDIPVDLERIFGTQLHDLLYQQLFLGNITPRLLNKIAYNKEYVKEHLNMVLNAFEVAVSQMCGLKRKKDTAKAKNAIISTISIDSKEDKETGRYKGVDQRAYHGPSTAHVIKNILKLSFVEVGDIPKPLQILFIGMAPSFFLPEALINLLSIGPSQDPSQISSDSFILYLQASEYLGILQDLAAFISAMSSIPNDMEYNLRLVDISTSGDKKKVTAFIKKNVSSNSCLVQFLDFLK